MAEVLQNPLFAVFVLVLVGVLAYVVTHDENIPAFIFLLFAALGAIVTMTGLGQISLLRMVLLPLLIVLLFAKSIRGGRRLPVLSTVLIIAYMVVVYISGTLNNIPFGDYRGELGVLLVAVVVSLAPNQPETFRKLTVAIAIWGLVNALVVFSTWLGVGWGGVYGSVFNEGGRAVGLMRHSTFMSIYFAIALLAIQVMYLQTTSKLLGVIYLGIGLAIFLGMLNALSRGAVAGWLAGFLFIQYRLRGLRLSSVVGIAALGAIAIGLSALVNLDDLMLGRFQNMEDDNSAQARLPLLNAAINAVWESPFFGSGVGWEFAEMRLEAHNMFMQVLVEAGIIGFLFFIVLTWKGGWSLLKGSRLKANASEESAAYKTGLAAMLGAILVDSLTHSFDYFMPFWLLLGVGFIA